MPGLADSLPNAPALLALAPEDLAMLLLEVLQKGREPRFTLSGLVVPLYAGNTPPYLHTTKQAVTRAVAEAWQWLQNEGLLMHDPEQVIDWYCLTRKAEKLKSRIDIEAYQQGRILPVALLHPRLAEKVMPMFTRGDYEVAVFQAFKEVEVTVRRHAELSDDLLGVKLMREAFKPENGKLTRMDTVPGERVAIMELYAGAMGHFKNPPSHRDTKIRRNAAAQLICFASYLLDQADFASMLS